MKEIKTTQDFINFSENIHGNLYDYRDTIFESMKKKVIIGCELHGKFEQYPYLHIKGMGCKKCSHDKLRKERAWSPEKFQEEVFKHNKNFLILNLDNYINNHSKMKVRCLKHDHVFSRKAQNLLVSGDSCIYCKQEREFQKFLIKVNKLYKNKYNYDKSKYVNNQTKIEIECEDHGSFFKTPASHSQGTECPECTKLKNLEKRKKEYFDEVNKIHNYKYDYSESVFNGSFSKLKIKCEKHGYFYLSATSHKSGRKCQKCSLEERTGTLEGFISDSIKTHGPIYDYSRSKYVNSNIPVEIGCEKHGYFWQNPAHHKKGQGCSFCGFEKSAKSKIVPFKEVIKRAKEVHGDDYDYTKTEKNYVDLKTPTIITCKKKGHGDFIQQMYVHLTGCGCQKCHNSFGEREIRKYLDNKNIKYKEQKKFKGCKNIHGLPFDFYLPNQNICVEYQGEQHYKPIDIWGGITNLKGIQKRDKIKRDFCKKNSIKLIEIPYWDKDKIEEILDKELYINISV